MIIKASLSAVTRRTYKRSWKRFEKFVQAIMHKQTSLPCSHTDILFYIAHLHQQKLSPATIACHLSAVTYFHKMKGFEDPCKHFLVGKAMTGIRNISKSCDIRLPITRPILGVLLDSLSKVVRSSYDRKLLRAMFTMAFHAFLRIGEMVPRSPKFSSNTLTMHDITLTDNDNKCIVTLRKFKHSNKQGAQNIIIVKNVGKQHCPVHAACKYLKARGTKPGPFFKQENGKPYLAGQFNQNLRKCLNYCGFSPSLYKGHSFRIGAATDAAEQGRSDAQIRHLGRWASDAYRKYIRISNNIGKGN